MSIHAHYTALAAVLRAGLPPGCKLYEWDVPEEPAYPYVVLWGDIGQMTGESLCGTPDLLNLRARLTYAGLTGSQLLIVVDAVRPLLNDRVIPVDGWAPTRIRQTSLQDAQADYSVSIPSTRNHPVFCVDEFPFTSQRK